MQEQDSLLAEVEPLLGAAGLRIVDFSLARRHGSREARMTVYAPAGTGTEECAAAHRILAAAIERLFGDAEPWIEVSSPGLERVIRSEREYAVFAGRGLRLLRKEGGDWIAGRIAGVEGGDLLLDGAGGRVSIPLSTVAKARLDSTQEGV